ncbi:ArpU family phage packaging/lysis transcriptional regulator [Fructilactobacillus sp. Tb1]|uniref:ArpU family phage packaging/lysis transcriptional regulator n=1 Tax=Fructilactobacillus sp. Tb1 TaxID=3422304 RepID=UPI003D2D55D5
MELFPEINQRKTVNNAKRFFKYQFPKMQIQASINSLSIKSPIISDIPSGTPYGNSSERKNVLMLQRQEDVRNVVKAIKSLPSFEKFILNAVYLEGSQDSDVALDLDYSTSRYQALKCKALLDFAVAIEVYGLEIVVYEK